MPDLRPSPLLCLALCLVVAGPALGAPPQAAPAAAPVAPAAPAARPAPAPAPAEEDVADPSEDLDKLVEGHVRRADQASARGQHQVAVDELQAAYQMDPQPVFLFKAGQAYQRGGQTKEALTMY